MRLLIALFLPWLTFFTIGRPFAGLICLILQITLLGWLPATIWAVYALSQYKTDQKIKKALRAWFRVSEIIKRPVTVIHNHRPFVWQQLLFIATQAHSKWRQCSAAIIRTVKTLSESHAWGVYFTASTKSLISFSTILSNRFLEKPVAFKIPVK